MIEIFDPLPPAALPEAIPPQVTAPLLPAPRQPGEAVPEYRARVLCYALAHGLGGLSLDELTAADQGAAWAVANLPARLDQEEHRHLQPVDRQLHDLRHAIARRQDAHRRAWAAIVAQLDQDEPPTPEERDEPTDQDAPQETDQDRAVRLLRAGLMLLMGDQGGQDDGGKGARLQKPPTPRPPAAPGLPNPAAPAKGGRF